MLENDTNSSNEISMDIEMIKYWMMKSEPGAYSIEDLKRDLFTSWEGVRNFQARNMMRDEMNEGDLSFFYHSNAKPPGVAGICRISRNARPDIAAQDKKSHYYDPKSSSINPIWYMVDVEYVETFPSFVSLKTLRETPELKGLKVLEKGSRLSILPIEKSHFEIICSLGRQK